LIGLSPAYGAFLAGLVVGNTADRAKMMSATQPIQAVLIMVFFLSIGLLIDIAFIWANLWLVAVLVLVVTVVKTAMNIGIIRLFGESWKTAFLAGTVMGQVGEFSFVLVAAGLSVGLIGDGENRLLVSLIALSLAVSPLWLITARRLEAIRWRERMKPKVILQRLYGRELRSLARVARPGYGAVHQIGGRVTRMATATARIAKRPFQRRARSATTTPHQPAGDVSAGSPDSGTKGME
jgi:CPA2 family monovalent cation:H+ antiporter-2